MTTVSNERIFEIVRSPLISEKSTFVSQFNYYVFKVARNSTKPEIKAAIEKLFSVQAFFWNQRNY